MNPEKLVIIARAIDLLDVLANVQTTEQLLAVIRESAVLTKQALNQDDEFKKIVAAIANIKGESNAQA